jgi:hypothetical protein
MQQCLCKALIVRGLPWCSCEGSAVCGVEKVQSIDVYADQDGFVISDCGAAVQAC